MNYVNLADRWRNCLYVVCTEIDGFAADGYRSGLVPLTCLGDTTGSSSR